MEQRRFNLIDEPWLPISDVGRVSLRQVFSEPSYRALSGDPVQKIALMKLLLAIAQAASTPVDRTQWQTLGAPGLARHCLDYLEKWHDRFYLFGDRPFLQMPAIAKAQKQSYGAVKPEIATGNTTVLSQIHVERQLHDADKALLLVVLMGFALGGKKTDNSVVLTPDYNGKSNDKGRPSTGKPGPSIAHMGLLHSFLLGTDLWHSLWINLFTEEQIHGANQFPEGIGTPPWESMPEGEACPIALKLQRSLMGRLVPLCRFVLLRNDGLHYSEGIAHADYHDGMEDPTVAVDRSSKKTKVLWVNPEKRPWRELTALLSLLAQQKHRGFQCRQIDSGLQNACSVSPEFAIWSGGLRVSSNAGEQYVSGNDDFVESQVWLHGDLLGEVWFAQLQAEMTGLEDLAKAVYGCVMSYYKTQKVDGKAMAEQATQLFWQLCERDFQALLEHCDSSDEHLNARRRLRSGFAGYALQVYDQLCPHDTARQLDAWAPNRPRIGKYLKQED